MDTTFIYALCEPGTRTVRYIGMTKNPKRRMSGHLSKARGQQTNHRECWLFSLISKGLKPEMVILREVPRATWKTAEERYIRLARGCGMNLTNGSDGGDGRLDNSPQTRKKISEKMTGKLAGEKHPMFGRTGINSPLFGRKHTPEAIANMSGVNHPMFGKTGSLCPQFGRKHTEDYKTKMSLRNSGEGNPMFGRTGEKSPSFNKPKTQEHRAALSEAKKGVPWSPERRAAHEARKAAK